MVHAAIGRAGHREPEEVHLELLDKMAHGVIDEVVVFLAIFIDSLNIDS